MTLTTLSSDEFLDLPAYRGQRVERFRYEHINGVTGAHLGWITPQRDSVPRLDHSTTQSIKRRLTLSLGVNDTNAIDPIADRILPFMEIGGTTWSLGRYMFTDETDIRSTRGDRGAFVLLDEGFIIDQQFDTAFSSPLSTSLNSPSVVSVAVLAVLKSVPSIMNPNVAPTPYIAVGAFSAGQTRGQALDAYATQGDYFPYWMNNDGRFTMIRIIDPGSAVPDFDFDTGGKVQRDGITFTRDVLTAPNRFVVTSNSGVAQTGPIVGSYDIPSSAPHSLANRGFTIVDTKQLQVDSVNQANAAARNLGIRNTVYERVSLNTALDPRHDSYNVIRWAGSNWLELAWSMNLSPGGTMSHTMRKAYG